MCAPDLICSVEADVGSDSSRSDSESVALNTSRGEVFTHSGDVIEVWHGSAEPLYVCGFHVSSGAWLS